MSASSPPASPIEVRYDHGIYLPGPDLWLDPGRIKTRAFVSHAHADHFLRHHTIITSATNARILDARYGPQENKPGSDHKRVRSGGKKGAARPRIQRRMETHDWHRPFPVAEDYQATLLPAGHVLGSAQIYIERLSDGATLLYTGDFKLRPGLAAEPPEWKRADSLIMETTFGRKQYVLPPTEELVARLAKFVEDSFAQQCSPVLLGYSLGKAQEILSALDQVEVARGAPILLHESVYRMTQVYRELGWSFPTYRKFPSQSGSSSSHSVKEPELDPNATPPSKQPKLALGPTDLPIYLFPPSAHRKSLPKGCRYAMFSGWAIDASARYRYRVDEVIPLSDHADHPDLLKFVELVQPRHVHTLHGFAADFARDLRALGYDAWSLVSDDQLELDL